MAETVSPLSRSRKKRPPDTAPCAGEAGRDPVGRDEQRLPVVHAGLLRGPRPTRPELPSGSVSHLHHARERHRTERDRRGPEAPALLRVPGHARLRQRRCPASIPTDQAGSTDPGNDEPVVEEDERTDLLVGAALRARGGPSGSVGQNTFQEPAVAIRVGDPQRSVRRQAGLRPARPGVGPLPCHLARQLDPRDHGHQGIRTVAGHGQRPGGVHRGHGSDLARQGETGCEGHASASCRMPLRRQAQRILPGHRSPRPARAACRVRSGRGRTPKRAQPHGAAARSGKDESRPLPTGRRGRGGVGAGFVPAFGRGCHTLVVRCRS